MLIQLYRKYTPTALKRFIFKTFLVDILVFINFHRSKLSCRFRSILPQSSKNKAYIFQGQYGITMLPYEFSIPYKQLVVEQHLDKGNGLIYVAHNGKKLYFPRHFSPQKIDNCYKTLLIEQDGASPHRYVEFPNELTGKTLLDVGAAEGIFALDVIDFAEQVYLFECEDYWIEALQATFAPYKNKTSIVKKYVSNRNDEINVTIDTLLEEKGIDNLFVKMDIEGAELSALQGAIHTIKTGKNISLAICTYHRPNDAADISNLFANVGLKYHFTEGLMFLLGEFRKGVIRGNR